MTLTAYLTQAQRDEITGMRQLEWIERATPKLAKEPEDRRELAVVQFINGDVDAARQYIFECASDEWMLEFARLLSCGEDTQIGKHFRRLASTEHVCDGAERYFGSER